MADKNINEYNYRPFSRSSDFDGCVEKIKNRTVIGCVDNSPENVISEIAASFIRGGYNITEIYVDPEEYLKFVHEAGYKERYPQYYPDNFNEKTLEHFLTVNNLDFRQGDVFIDIASEQSPLAEVCRRLYRVTAYSQDIMYPAGIEGHRIGGDACQMPVPDGFADRVALTCSFEHFEGDSDSRLIKEIGRVLKPGGKAYIVPLYLYLEHSVQTDPTVSVPNNVSFDRGAVVYCAQNWGNRFARFYDFTAFSDRIQPVLDPFEVEIQLLHNVKEIHESCYAKFALLLEKK